MFGVHNAPCRPFVGDRSCEWSNGRAYCAGTTTRPAGAPNEVVKGRPQRDRALPTRSVPLKPTRKPEAPSTKMTSVGPAVGARYTRIHFEFTARKHTTQFEVITRDYSTASVREITRTPRNEGSWGALARLMIAP